MIWTLVIIGIVWPLSCWWFYWLGRRDEARDVLANIRATQMKREE